MADIVTLHGDEVDDNDTKDLVSRLREIISKIESGEIRPEKWILILTKTNLKDPNKVSTESYDSGITVSEAVYILSGSIHDLHEAVRCG